MRSCAFNNYSELPCPMETASYVEIRELCEPGEYGVKCGAILAQKVLAETVKIGTLTSELDKRLGLIEGNAHLIVTPAGDAPEAIREATINVYYPLRIERPKADGVVAISHEDLVLTLMQSGKLEQANWYKKYYNDTLLAGGDFTWWLFNADEVRVNDQLETRGSIDHYDDSFRLDSPSLWNSHVTPLMGVRHAYDGSALPRNAPISNSYDSKSRTIVDVELPETK